MDDTANPNSNSKPQTPGLTPANPNNLVPGSSGDFTQQQSTNPFPTNDSIPQNNSLNVPTQEALNPGSSTSELTNPITSPNPSFSSTPNPFGTDLNASNMNTPPGDTPIGLEPTNPSNLSSDPTSLSQPLPSEPVPTFPPQQPTEPSFSQAVGSTTPITSPIIGSIDTTQTAPESEAPEPAPTDLSQLTGSSMPQQNSDIYSPSVAAPDSLVVPTSQPIPSPGDAVSTATVAGTKHTLPLIAIIGAIIVVLAVAGASAYFILGIGKPQAKSSTSLPIVQSSQAPLTKPPVQPTLEPVSSPQEASSSGNDSGSFGSLDGETAIPTPAPSGPKTAADLLKAKQASTKPSATPKPSASPVATP